MVHQGPLADVILGVEDEHFDVQNKKTLFLVGFSRIPIQRRIIFGRRGVWGTDWPHPVTPAGLADP